MRRLALLALVSLALSVSAARVDVDAQHALQANSETRVGADVGHCISAHCAAAFDGFIRIIRSFPTPTVTNAGPDDDAEELVKLWTYLAFDKDNRVNKYKFESTLTYPNLDNLARTDKGFAKSLEKAAKTLCKATHCDTTPIPLTNDIVKQLVGTEEVAHMLRVFAKSIVAVEWVLNSNKFKEKFLLAGGNKGLPAQHALMEEPIEAGYPFVRPGAIIYRGMPCEFTDDQAAVDFFKIGNIVHQRYAQNSAFESGTYSPYVAAGYGPSDKCTLVLKIKGPTRGVDISATSCVQQEVLLPPLHYVVDAINVARSKTLVLAAQGVFKGYTNYGALTKLKDVANPFCHNQQEISTLTYVDGKDRLVIEVTVSPVDGEYKAVPHTYQHSEFASFAPPKFEMRPFADIDKEWDTLVKKKKKHCTKSTLKDLIAYNRNIRKGKCDGAVDAQTVLACPHGIAASMKAVQKYDARLLDELKALNPKPNAKQMSNFLLANQRFEEETLPKLMTYDGAVHAAKLFLALAKAEGTDVEKIFDNNPNKYVGDIKSNNFDWQSSNNLRVLMTACLHVAGKTMNVLPDSVLQKRQNPEVCDIFGDKASTPPFGWPYFKGAIELGKVPPEFEQFRVRAAMQSKHDQTYLYPSDFPLALTAEELTQCGLTSPAPATTNVAKWDDGVGITIGENSHFVVKTKRPLDGAGATGFGFVEQAKRLGKLVFTGPSGTSQKVMERAVALGLSQDELLLFRLALLGWQNAVRDHSFFEVMVAMDGYGPDLAYPHPSAPKPTWIRGYEFLLPARKLQVRPLSALAQLIAGTAVAPTASAYDLTHLEAHLGVSQQGQKCYPSYYVLTHDGSANDVCGLGTRLPKPPHPASTDDSVRSIELPAGLKVCHGGENPGEKEALMVAESMDLCRRFASTQPPTAKYGIYPLNVISQPSTFRTKAKVKLAVLEGKWKRALEVKVVENQGRVELGAAAAAKDFCRTLATELNVHGFFIHVGPEIPSCEYLDDDPACAGHETPSITPGFMFICKWDDHLALVHRSLEFKYGAPAKAVNLVPGTKMSDVKAMLARQFGGGDGGAPVVPKQPQPKQVFAKLPLPPIPPPPIPVVIDVPNDGGVVQGPG